MVDKEKDTAIEGAGDRQERLLVRSRPESVSDLLESMESPQHEEMTDEWRSFYLEVKKAVEGMRL